MVLWNRAMINQCFISQLLELPKKFCIFHKEYFSWSPKSTKHLVRKCIGSCHNPSLGLMTNAKAYKGVGQKKNPGFTFHAPRSVGGCEGTKSHTPKSSPTLGIGIPMAFKFSENNYKVKTHWIEFFFIPLEISKCLKGAYTFHSNI